MLLLYFLLVSLFLSTEVFFLEEKKMSQRPEGWLVPTWEATVTAVSYLFPFLFGQGAFNSNKNALSPEG